MANGAIKFKDNSGNVVSYISGSGQNIHFSGGTLNLSGMSSITLGNTTLTATSASYAGNYLLTSSFNTYTGTTNASARLNSIESATGSFATTGSNLFKGTQTYSGSLVPSTNGLYDLGDSTHQFRHLYLSSASLYIDGTKVLGSTSQELQITTDIGQSFKILETGSDNITLQSADGNIEVKTSGGGDVILDPNTGVIALKGTATVYSGYRILSSDGNNIHFGNGVTISGSILATGTSLVSGSSQISYTGLSNVPSGIISGSAQLPTGIISGSGQLPSGIVSSSAQVTGYGFATTGSNNFIGTQTVTGSLYVSANLIVQGSSSLQDITGSNVYIGTNKINLNTNTPAIRFGGISVFDSGSNYGESGSLLWDSQNNRWLYQHPTSSGAPYKSAIIISGPMNSGSLGSESTLTTGKIQKAVGDDHIGDSIITETSGGIGISGSLSITGSIIASGTSIWSGSGQLPSGTVSGSVQIDVMSTTNIARLATTGSNTFNGNIIVTGNTTVGGYYTFSSWTTGTINKIRGYSANDDKSIQWNYDNSPAGTVIRDNNSILLSINSGSTLSATSTGVSVSGSLTTTDNIILSKAVDPKISSGTNIGLNIDGAALWLNRYSQSNIIMVPNGGNVGVGGSPTGTYGKLSVAGGIRILDDNNGKLEIGRYSSGVSNSYIKLGSNSNSLRFTNNTDAADILELTNSGHLGLSVTPSPWATPFNVIQGGSYGQSIGFQTNGPDIKLGTNNYYNGSGYVYVTSSNGAAQLNVGGNSGFQFNTAPSGTSGSTITFTTAMSITNGGNVIIGSGTTATSLDISSRTDAISLPKGTTGQRPGTPASGMYRFNTTNSKPEYYNGSIWVTVGASGDGSSYYNPASSAKSIKAIVGNPSSGVYWLQVPNVNSGNPFQCYCDFTIDGGIGYALIFNQYFTGAETGPSHASFGSSTISTAGFDTEYQVAPTAMISNYGLTKLAVFARTGGSSSGGITGANYYNWVAFTGPTTTQFNNIFTNGYGANQFTGTFNSSDGNTGTAYFPNSHGNSGGVTQISTNGGTVNDYILYEYNANGGTDPNHFWLVLNGRSGDNYWIANTRYGSSSGNVMYNRWGGVAIY